MARQARLVSLLGFVSVVGLSSPVLAQHRHHHAAPTPPPPATPPPAAPAEVISVPVPDVDGMLRRMRVYLFTPPAGSNAFGGSPSVPGRRIWALLPSCRPANPDDPRDQCPVDRIVIEAIAGNGVAVGDPQTLSSAPDTRRVQSIVVSPAATRVRIKVMNMRNVSRYEAVIESAGLADLPAPQGEARGGAFAFDLTQYPAR